jgi:vacuolar-type H+-ATPase subunit E/Vma4
MIRTYLDVRCVGTRKLTIHRKGGVFLAGSGGKIELDNTFEARLKLCETDALPSARVTLFGENDNRKFHD